MSNTDSTFKNIGLIAPDVLLPKNSVNMYKWATVACDQYTSEPEYWNDVKTIVENSPSTYNLMLPEIYLENENVDSLIKKINQNMKDYVDSGLFTKYPQSFILTKRSTPYSPVRTGLVAALDLEQYDFHKGAKAPIRATEGTVTERIPPRMKVRKNAILEMPHIMILIDDPQKTVIEPAVKMLENASPLYSTELMKNGGFIEGYLINQETAPDAFDSIFSSIEALNEKSDGFLFAVGDGNHSLASAKCHYEELKKLNLPCENARYAMVEIVNLHDAGIIFEPIHRVVFNIDSSKILSYFKENGCSTDCEMPDSHVIPYITKEKQGKLCIPKASHMLAVGALQQILDRYVADNENVKIDYIHGEDSLKELSAQENNIGFFLSSMDKNDLFPTVAEKGALPRKTFSMGEACEKRYYMECRIIADNL
ncbi:MAG: DUF1015 domain-containing protein [Ruminococcaceae bacterium]|nr:DUF1015 domain-containing protein [Oscillospiraceae bacterium]